MTSECTCPPDLEEMVMIEYPGFVKNPDKAMLTLGGLESIEKVVGSQKDRLELKFRKSDPFAHPAYGDREPKKCLVMRIRKRKSNNQSSTTSEEYSPGFDINIIGRVQTSYKFETMAEFQWLPMQRTNESHEEYKIDPAKIHSGFTVSRSPQSLNPEYASILDDVLPIRNPFDNTLKNFNLDAPLLLLPAVFSRFDTPREIHQPHPKFRSKEMRDEFERQENLSIIGRTRKKRSTMSCIKYYNDLVPDRPPEKLVLERSSLSAQEEMLKPRLQDCFERQRVWSKNALCFELNCAPKDIKYILPLVAFHYQNGPFRTMWVKYGYNPHIDNSSKILQTLDFRVKNSSQDNQGYSRRSIHQYQQPMRKNPDKLRNKQQLDLRTLVAGASSNNTYHGALGDPFDDTIGNDQNQVITESMCKFRRDMVPTARQLSYQLKDIEIEEVQAIVHCNDNKMPEICSEKDGWLPEGSIDKIRKIMNKILSDTFDTMMNAIEISST